MRRNIFISVFFIFLSVSFAGFAQSSSSIKITAGQNYYTTEKQADILLYIPAKAPVGMLKVDILYGRTTLAAVDSITSGLNEIPVSITGLPMGENRIHCILQRDQVVLDTFLVVKKMEPKPNEVKINLKTGGLIVNGLPFIPFGFYCYSPVQPTLPEEETVRGFNMMSPYQKVEAKTLKSRKAYMDRCAQLGMKVHYNLLSVSGGGGVGSGRLSGLSQAEKRKRLIREINTFKDHPALLAWYISDEPVGQGKPVEPLVETYKLIKKIDPYHPVSIVFMTPSKAREYAGATDIVMADPYPVPNGSPEVVGLITRRLKDEFYLEKPVWIVPQAFGGNEWWKREPTAGEMRVMTWLSLIEGARGIQYFVRHGMNAFPKSVVAWNECSDMAHEVSELTPDLALGEVVKDMICSDPAIRTLTLKRGGKWKIIVVNTENRPKEFSLTFPIKDVPEKATVIFENRNVSVLKGNLSDMIDGYGTRVYSIEMDKAEPVSSLQDSLNMVVNPGFEDNPSPGVPSGCYARLNGDRGATFFIDSRVAHRGQHAVRLVNPSDGKGMGLSFFPVTLTPRTSYTISVWAKAQPLNPLWRIPEKNFFKWILNLFKKEKEARSFELSLGDLESHEFNLSSDWKKYTLSVESGELLGKGSRQSPYIELKTSGTAWFDDLQVFPDITMESNAQRGHLTIVLKNNQQKGSILYTLDSTQPALNSRVFTDSINIYKSTELKASLLVGDQLSKMVTRYFQVHDALGKKVQYKNLYSPRYSGGGKQGLVDGLLASDYFKDKLWQGFLKKDLNVVIDLGKIIDIKSISLRFLQNLKVDIYPPTQVCLGVSEDGKQYKELQIFQPDSSRSNSSIILQISKDFNSVAARYIRIFAKNQGNCPAWTVNAGSPAWLFTDEIVINNK